MTIAAVRIMAPETTTIRGDARLDRMQLELEQLRGRVVALEARYSPVSPEDRAFLERILPAIGGAVVALANKLVCIAWAVLTRDEPYRPPVLAVAT